MAGLTEESLRAFTEALASGAPVPGGGGASALCGALGAALGGMVGSLTAGKPKYAAAEPALRALMAEAAALREELLSLVDADAEAFAPLAAAYGLPKDAPGRAEELERCLRGAAQVPMRVVCLACRAIELQREFAEKGGALVISDAGTGAALCRAALEGAAMNVRVNTRLMSDRVYAGKLDAETAAMLDKYRPMAEEVWQSVMGRLGAHG